MDQSKFPVEKIIIVNINIRSVIPNTTSVILTPHIRHPELDSGSRDDNSLLPKPLNCGILNQVQDDGRGDLVE